MTFLALNGLVKLSYSSTFTLVMRFSAIVADYHRRHELIRKHSRFLNLNLDRPAADLAGGF
jgi:hypothetical protein